jgi:hypothetical protein
MHLIDDIISQLERYKRLVVLLTTQDALTQHEVSFRQEYSNMSRIRRRLIFVSPWLFESVVVVCARSVEVIDPYFYIRVYTYT